MNCRLCNREAINNKLELCSYHDECHKKVEASFEKWRLAYGELDWLTYLQIVCKRSETGIWVKECCELLKEKKSVKNA